MLMHLVLLLLLSGVDRASPLGLDLLTLDPPQLLGEYGAEVTVNCSSSTRFHNGMYWKHGHRESNLTVNASSASWTLSLTEWNVTTAECVIKLNDTFDFSKRMEINLYKSPDMVTLYPIKHMNNTEAGSAYELQCDILETAPVQNITVRWYLDDRLIRTHSFNGTSRTLANESSFHTLVISRGDDGAEVRCEAQLDFGPGGPKPAPVSDKHAISVHYAPEFNATADDIIWVTQGDDVTLTCDAAANPPPTFHWTRENATIGGSQKRLDVTGVRANATYACTAVNHLGSATKHVHVHVMEEVMNSPAEVPVTPGPENAICPLKLTPDEVVVRFKDGVSINCSVTDSAVHGIGWEAADYGTGILNVSTLTWTTPSLVSWTMTPQCYTSTKSGHQCNVAAKIIPYKMPDVVTISSVSPGPFMEDTEHLLTCYVINVGPLDRVIMKWYQDDTHVFTEKKNTSGIFPGSLSSNFRVTLKSQDDGAKFRCDVEMHLGPNGPSPVPTTRSGPYTAVVHYKPSMQHCPTHFSGVENNISLSMFPCRATGNPAPVVRWYFEGKLVNTSEPLTRSQSGVYTAEVVNSLSNSSTSIQITVESGPSFTCRGGYEVRADDEVQIPCEAEGEPAPVVTWFKDGREMVLPQRWTKHDSGVYVLKATNKHGTATHTLQLDVLYKPSMQHCPTHFSGVENNISLSMFPCRATGNPAPVVHWYFNGKLVDTSEPLARGQSGVYTAEVVNGLSNSSTSIQITVEYGPSFSCRGRYEVRADDVVQTLCDAEGEPAPVVTWFKGQLDGQEMVQRQRWTKHDSGDYVLIATNKHGTATHTLQLDVLFAPEFHEGDDRREVSTGDNVTLVCGAEGNPVPEVLWNFTSAANARQAAGGRQRSVVSIVEATSANAGGYVCVATNEVGRVSRTVTVLLKGAHGGRLSLVLWMLLLFLIVILLALVLFLCRRKKKHGEYSFIANNEMDGIPMTAKAAGGKA